MSVGVFTLEPRFRFIRKTESDVGEGTIFPMEVTGDSASAKLDKIAEIFFRAKSAQFTENNLTFPFEPPINFGVEFGTVEPRVMYSAQQPSAIENNYLMSGYWTVDTEGAAASDYSKQYLDDSYDSFHADSIGEKVAASFRDISDNERGMWLPQKEDTQPIWNLEMPEFTGLGSFFSGSGEMDGVDEQGFRTAFSWYSKSLSGSPNPPNIPVPWLTQTDGDIIYESIELMVEFGGRVAFVGSGEEDGLYHNDTKFYVEIRVRGFIEGLNLEMKSDESGTGDAQYIIRLSSGDLSCALGSSQTGFSGNIVHEANDWWPYQTSDGDVWEKATGKSKANELNELNEN